MLPRSIRISSPWQWPDPSLGHQPGIGVGAEQLPEVLERNAMVGSAQLGDAVLRHVIAPMAPAEPRTTYLAPV